MEGPWPARAGAIQVSRTQQKSLNASIARPNSPSASRIRRQSRVCMCKAPLPGYLSTATPLPARSPAMAVDLLVALRGQLVQTRWGDQEVGAGALTKVNEGGRPSGAEGPCRQASLGRSPGPRRDDLQARCSRSARIRPWRNGVRLDRLPKDYARCAAAGIVGGDGNSIAIGFAEELHAEAFVKCDGLQI